MKKKNFISIGIAAAMSLTMTAGTAQALTVDDILGFFKQSEQESSGTTESNTPTTPQKAPDKTSGGTTAPTGVDPDTNLSILAADTYLKDLSGLRDAVQGQSATSAKPENDGSGYERSNYKHWEKVSNPGDWGNEKITSSCKTDKAAIIRQAKDIEVDKSCKITGVATVMDAYTQGSELKSKDSGSFQNIADVDHVVALQAVESSGGYKMDAKTRQEIANDPINLIVASAKENRSKGAKTVDQYLPKDEETKCLYVSRVVQVKKKYDLSVSGAERKVLEDTGASCGFK